MDAKPASEPAKPPRQCYCTSLDADFRQKQHIPDGYCGLCERCGQPGHTQHFPGPLPYTGAWCDRCVKIVALTWPLKNPLVWAVLLAVLITGLTFYFRK